MAGICQTLVPFPSFLGFYYRSLTRSRQDFQRNDAALAVSEDLAVHFQGADLSALPSAATEVQTLAKQFPHTEILAKSPGEFYSAFEKSLASDHLPLCRSRHPNA